MFDWWWLPRPSCAGVANESTSLRPDYRGANRGNVVWRCHLPFLVLVVVGSASGNIYTLGKMSSVSWRFSRGGFISQTLHDISSEFSLVFVCLAWHNQDYAKSSPSYYHSFLPVRGLQTGVDACQERHNKTSVWKCFTYYYYLFTYPVVCDFAVICYAI